MFFSVQLQLKISVIFSRILRNNAALAGAVCEGGSAWQTLIIVSLNAISQLRSHFCVWMVQKVAEFTVALQRSLLFLANRWLLSGKECLGLFPFLCCPFWLPNSWSRWSVECQKYQWRFWRKLYDTGKLMSSISWCSGSGTPWKNFQMRRESFSWGLCQEDLDCQPTQLISLSDSK